MHHKVTTKQKLVHTVWQLPQLPTGPCPGVGVTPAATQPTPHFELARSTVAGMQRPQGLLQKDARPPDNSWPLFVSCSTAAAYVPRMY
jgi:hypothetical protein